VTVERKKNFAGYYDEHGRFRPIRSPRFVGTPKRRATKGDKRKYSKAKAGDLGRKRQMLAREDVFDREIRLDSERAAKDERSRAREMRKIEREMLGSADERGMGKTLVQFVRSSGGIRNTGNDAGELASFTAKDSGMRGLVAKKGGKSLDYMYQAARESGYDVSDPYDLLDKMDDEIRGGKVTYANHGYMDYRDNPKSNLYVSQLGRQKFGVFLKTYLLKTFQTKAAAELYLRNVRSRVKKNPATAAQLAKAAIGIFDVNDDGKVTKKDVRILKRGQKKLSSRKPTTRRKTAAKSAAKKRPAPRKNPLDPIQVFATGASGILAALNIHEKLKRRKTRKRKNPVGTIKAKSSNRVNNPNVASTILSQLGGNKFLAMTGAKSLASGGKDLRFRLPSNFAKNGINIVKITLTPTDLYDVEYGKLRAGKHSVVKVSKGIYADSLREDFTRVTGLDISLGRIVKNPSAAEVKRCQKILAAEKGKSAKPTISRYWLQENPKRKKRAKRKNPVASAKAKTPLGSRAKNPVTIRKKNSVTGPGQKSVTRRSQKNPVKVPARRTFEMFQGRKATTAKEFPVSSHAPARLDQLGDLIELKLHGGQAIKLNPNRFKLCAANGKLWIVGGKFAKPNPAEKTHVLNPVAEIDYVVYGTRKPHHGDHEYTQYIHRLGEESGKRPILAVDRDGFPVIRGGNYTIEARGIVD
jgi:hypothetical protein